MRKFYLPLCALVLSALLYNCVSNQGKIEEKSDQDNIQNKSDQGSIHEREVSITYTWSSIRSHGSNQLAVWIEDTTGKHICTLFATEFTASGGYEKRPISLSEWTAKFDLKNSSREEVDAVTGATPESGKQILVWNGKDKSGKVVPDGKYVVRMEANIHNEDKMFFRGEIKIGEPNQTTNGKITYSSPNLASGDVLFKDVLVEYKKL